MNAEQILIQLAHFVADNKKAARELKSNSEEKHRSYYTAYYDSMIAMSVELVGIADSIDSSGNLGASVRGIINS